MKARYSALGAAMIVGGSFPTHALALPDLSFSGFGTIAEVHSSESNADFVGTIFQPNGAGHTDAWSFKPDSKLGGQINAVFNDKFSAVVQVVSQDQYDDSFTPHVEWANVKYQATPELSVRLGRIALPTSMLSESRFVGYSYTWVRPPLEVYMGQPITSNDGVDASWRHAFGGVNNTLQGYYGGSKVDITGGSAKSNDAWGLTDSVEIGDLSMRAGYSSNKVDLVLSSLDGLFAGLEAFAAAPPPIGPQAQALLQKYKLNGMQISTFSLGATYDPGTWFLMSEFVAFKGAGFLSDTRSWYASAGYRLGKFTPYLVYSTTKADIKFESGISSPDAAMLNAGLNATLNAFSATQSSTSAGVRWDFMKNFALKGQYDRVNLGDNSAGHLTNLQPGFKPGGSVNLVSVALDFIF